MSRQPHHLYAFTERPAPKPGTASRRVYDDLLAGKAVRLTDPGMRSNMQNYHGFELVRAPGGMSRAVFKLGSGAQVVRIWPSA